MSGWMNHSLRQGIMEGNLDWEEDYKFIFGMLILRGLWSTQ